MAEQKLDGRIRSLKLTRPQWEVADAIRQRLEVAAGWITARNERLEAARERYQRPLSTATRVLPLEAPPGFADVDQERYDRALLIDGHRGEGKTSVLMKMLDTWNVHALSRLDRHRAPAERAKKKSRSKGDDGTVRLPEGVFVVPLPTLDLPAMPRGQDVPLASLVLNCFSSLVSELVEDRRKNSAPAREHDGEPRVESLRDRWDWLHRSLASKYSHASKRQRDDSLQYARELQDDTRRVYEIDDRFRLFIDALSEEVTRRFALESELPVFVIAIDDLDLAAHATIDLLDVLRVFQHPAVFFVMTGDYENLHRCVRNAPSMLSLFPNAAEEEEHRFGRSALASDIVERIFPRQNVLRLDSPKLDERLSVAWKKDSTVRALLEKLSKRVPLLGAAVESADGDKLGRLGLVLPTRMRRLVNLCERLSALAEDDRDDLAVEVAQEFWRAALAEHGLEYPKGMIREFFERRVDSYGNVRLTVAALKAESVPGEGALVIERAGKRFELSTLAHPVKPLQAVGTPPLPASFDPIGLFTVLLELCAHGVEPESDGLPPFFNRTLVRTTYARDSTVYQLDWPLPRMTVDEYIRLRRLWASWLSHPHIATAVTDEKLSVIELYLLALGWVCEGARQGWSDLRRLVADSKTRVESLAKLEDARKQAWVRVRAIATSEGSEDRFRQWGVESIPLLGTASAWDTATSSRGIDVVHVISREMLRGGHRMPSRGVRVSREWNAVSAYLLDDSWELLQGVDVIDPFAQAFFDRVISVSPKVGAPIESMTIAQYVVSLSRAPVRGALRDVLSRPSVQRELREQPAEVGAAALMSELRLIGAYAGLAIDTKQRRLPDDWESQLTVSAVRDDARKIVDARSDRRLTVCGVHTLEEWQVGARAPFDRFVIDVAIDVGWVDVESLPCTVRAWPGLTLAPTDTPLLFCPAFSASIDVELLVHSWNDIRGDRFDEFNFIARWLVVCESVYSRRRGAGIAVRRLPSSGFECEREVERVVSVAPSSSIRGRVWAEFLDSLAMYASVAVDVSPETRAKMSSILRKSHWFASKSDSLEVRAERAAVQYTKWKADAADQMTASAARAREMLGKLRSKDVDKETP